MKKTKLSNLQIVVVAVARLGGDTQSIHTEDVAIEASNIAPGRFAWRKYPDRIDLELVRRTLAKMAEKEPPLLVGNARRGWMLSKHGLRWVEKNAKDLFSLEGFRRGSVSDAIEMERARLRETDAWRKYKSGLVDKLSLNDLYEFVRINEYFSDDKRHERFNIVATAVDGDTDLAQLWLLFQQQFPNQEEKQNG
jgi:hypothetical protein